MKIIYAEEMRRSRLIYDREGVRYASSEAANARQDRYLPLDEGLAPEWWHPRGVERVGTVERTLPDRVIDSSRR